MKGSANMWMCTLLAGACLTVALTDRLGARQSGPMLAELKTIVVPPPPPPPHTDPNTVDLSDKKGPLIPHIPSVVPAPQAHSWRVA